MDAKSQDDTTMETIDTANADENTVDNASSTGEWRNDDGDVEVEVVLISNDEAEGELPRTLTDDRSGFRPFLLAPGAIAAGIAAVLLLQRRAENRSGGVKKAAQKRVSGALGSVKPRRKRGPFDGIKRIIRIAPVPAPKSPWQQAVDVLGDVTAENAMTLIAIAASLGLTVAGRLADSKRDGSIELPAIRAKKPWYRGGLWA